MNMCASLLELAMNGNCRVLLEFHFLQYLSHEIVERAVAQCQGHPARSRREATFACADGGGVARGRVSRKVNVFDSQ